MTNSTVVSPVKMEYGWNFSISGLEMMMKSGLGKKFLKFLHSVNMSFLLLNSDQKYKFSKGPFLYYVRVFWGFFEPPTHLGKDIFTT